MPFDFPSFRRLLFQDALEDAIQVLKKNGPEGYAQVAGRISSQLQQWRRSTRWNPFSRAKRNKYHEAILRNLYRAGWAAARDESPPVLQSIHPVRSLLLGYAGAIGLGMAGYVYLSYEPECPSFDQGKNIAILIDRFESYHQPVWQKIGLDNKTFENHIKGKLSLSNVSAAVHPVYVKTRDDARERCRQCGAKMLIWGEVDYRGDSKANLYHYLDHESYEAYILKHGIPEAEEPYKGIFDLKTKQWIGEVTCLINLFQGLMAKEKFQMATDPAVKEEAIREADRLFDELTRCAIDDSLKLFALHCLAWAKTKQSDDQSALEMYNRILSIDSSDALALNNSALLYQKQENYLYANLRYERLLLTNDIPYVRLANAEALNKLNRKEEAQKEIDDVKRSDSYKGNRVQYDRKISTIKTSAYVPSGSVGTLAPADYLSTLATRFNAGDTRGTVRGLDSLSAKVDTNTFSREDLVIMRELYRNAGATEKAKLLDSRATEMGVMMPARSSVLNNATRRIVN